MTLRYEKVGQRIAQFRMRNPFNETAMYFGRGFSEATDMRTSGPVLWAKGVQ